jgi:hypothetical protein
MNARPLIAALATAEPFRWLLLAVCLGASSRAGAESPPVEVQVVVDGGEDDFFKRASTKTSSAPKVSVSAGSPKTGDQVSTQVVNVVVGGPSARAGAADPEAELAADMEEARARIRAARAGQAAPPAEQPAPPAREPAEADQGAEARGPHEDGLWRGPMAFWKRNWDRAPGLEKGDVLLRVLGGKSPAGGYGGLGLEYLATEHLGLTVSGFWEGLSGEQAFDSGGWKGWDFARGDRWANPTGLSQGQLERGGAYMVEVGANAHLRAWRHFDLYASLGVSHFGYLFDQREGRQLGGGVYGRVGVGFNWFWRAAFVGLDAGWYPVEAFRYEVRRQEDGSDLVAFEQRKDPFDPRRFVMSGHVGLRF